MIEVRRVRGDDPAARRLVVAMEAWVRLDTAQSMSTAMALYRSAGYRDIADYNGNRYASFWGEKVLGRGRTAAG